MKKCVKLVIGKNMKTVILYYNHYSKMYLKEMA